MSHHTFQIMPHKPIYQYGNNNRNRVRFTNKNGLKHASKLNRAKMTVKEENTTYNCRTKSEEQTYANKEMNDRSLYNSKSEDNEIPLQYSNKSCDSHTRNVDIDIKKFEPKVHVFSEDNVNFFEVASNQSDGYTIQMEVENDDEELRCPNCRITYMSKMSIKNHIQVCKVKNISNSSLNFIQNRTNNSLDKKVSHPKSNIHGICKLNEDEKKSLKILEESCFNNKDKIPYEAVAVDGENKSLNSVKQNYKCEECDEEYNDRTKFARHCYAHTFIKIGKNFLFYL